MRSRRQKTMTAIDAVKVAETVYSDLVDAARHFNNGTFANTRYAQRCKLAWMDADKRGVRAVVEAIMNPNVARTSRRGIVEHSDGGMLRWSVMHNGEVVYGPIPYLVAVLEGFKHEDDPNS